MIRAALDGLAGHDAQIGDRREASTVGAGQLPSPLLQVVEAHELGPGDRNPNYGLPTFFQAPRGVRFAVSYDW